MGPTKPTGASSSGSSSKTRSSVSLKKVKGENFYRDAKTVKRLKMLTGGKAVRDKDGKIVQAAAFQKGEDEAKPGRVQPDRRWFGNTRVISQTALDHFRESLQTRQNDPYSVLLRRNKLPMQLLDDASNPYLRKRAHIVETEPFGDTFGPKAQRKRARLDASSFEELSKLGSTAADEAEQAAVARDMAVAAGDPAALEAEKTHADYIEPIYAKGTSKRIYGELYKVIDSSDVILHVLDARDPLGTMCESVLEYVRKEKAHKQVVLIINKCDLVPNWVTARYIQHLTPRYPTIAFHASPNHSFGKGALIQLLRQFSQLHSDKKQISVGFVGYPNVGKSSVINTLKAGKVCRVAPVPGETKVWQYITLTRRIYLIDCPGIVPTSAHDSQTATVLKGVVRVEALPTPSEHVPTLVARVRPLYLSRTYGVPLPDTSDPSLTWDAEAFLDQLARMKGRLLKGGEPDLEAVAKIVLSDWVRGRIPYFVPPPERPAELNEREEKERKRRERAAERESERVPAVPGVKQKLGSIIQRNAFAGDDVRPVEVELEGAEEVDEGEDEGEEDVDGIESNGAAADEGDISQEAPLTWNDVFAEDGAEEGAPDTTEAETAQDAEDEWAGFDSTVEESADVSSEDGGEDEDEPEPSKDKRKTTSKKKAENFYTHANVKNKNRSKAATMRLLQGRQPPQGGGRRRNR